MIEKNDLEKLLKLLLTSDEKQIEKLIELSPNPNLADLLDRLKIFKHKDIDEIDSLFRKNLQKFHSQFMKPFPKNMIALSEDTLAKIPLFEPSIVNGKINGRSVLGLLLTDKQLAKELENRRFIHDDVKNLYEQSYRSHIISLKFNDALLKKWSDFERGILECLEDLGGSPIESLEELTAMDWVNLFHKQFSYLERFLTLYALGLEGQVKGPKVKETILHTVLEYFDKIDDRFSKIFNKYVEKTLRHKGAHSLFRALDESNVYYLSETNEKINYTKAEIKKAYYDLVMYFISLFDQFFIATVREILMAKAAMIWDYKFKEVAPLQKITGLTPLILLSEPNPHLDRSDWTKVLHAVRDFCSHQSLQFPFSALFSSLKRELHYSSQVLKHALDKLIEIGVLEKSTEISFSLAKDIEEDFESYLEKTD